MPISSPMRHSDSIGLILGVLVAKRILSGIVKFFEGPTIGDYVSYLPSEVNLPKISEAL